MATNQDLITSKDWDALEKTNILADFDMYSKAWESYVFEKDFVLDFIFNIDRFLQCAGVLQAGGIYKNDENIFTHVLERAHALNIDLDTDDFKSIIKNVITLMKSGKVNSYGLSFMAGPLFKEAKYIRVLLDDKLSNELSEAKIKIYSTKVTLDINEFKKFTVQEQTKLIPRLSFFNNVYGINLLNGDATYFETFIKTVEDANSVSKYLGIDVSKMLANIDPVKYTEMFLSFDKDNSLALSSWGDYYPKHPEFIFSNEQIKKLLEIYGRSCFAKIINNIDDSDVLNHKHLIGVNQLVSRKGMTLDRITEIKGHVNNNLIGARFFTEEEIVKNPHFFSPRVISNNPCLYCSKETFKLLNKTWDLRQRYNNYLTNVEEIIKNLGTNTLNIKALRYLKEKTNSSNETIVESLKKINIYRDCASPEILKILTITKFLRK